MKRVFKERIITERKNKASLKKNFVAEHLTPHVRRVFVQLANELFGNIIFYAVIGLFNRFFGLFGKRPIQGNFIFYATNERYLLTMVYKWYANRVRWKPGLGQVIWQNNGISLSFGISANEDYFYDERNKNKMTKLVKRAEFVAWLIGAKHLTYAGVLPGLFDRYGTERSVPAEEQENTVAAVAQSALFLKDTIALPEDTPIVILGGDGYVGKGVINYLKNNNYRGEIISIDVASGDKTGQLPKYLKGQKIIVINITKKCVLSDYVPSMWEGVYILNEVYPEPNYEEIKSIKRTGARCFHITGVRGKTIPNMGGAYAGGSIPCCAINTTGNKSKELPVVIHELQIA